MLPPALAEGVELLGEVAGSGYRRSPALVRRADGQTVQLSPLLYRLLEAIDGERDAEQLAARLGGSVGRLVSADDVRFLTEAKLRPLGLLRGIDGAEPNVEKANPLLALRFKFVASSPAATRRLTAPFAALFRGPIVLSVLVAFAVTTWWMVFDKGLASAAHEALYEPALLLAVLGLTLLSAGFHEVGHAAACRYSGARPGGMGVGLYLVWPAFYTDVTDSYRLSRGGRLRVDLGGFYFDAIFGLVVLGVWAGTGWDALLLVIAGQLLRLARQLIPVVRFDGYHVLADLTGVPDLFAHIKPTLLGLLPTRWGSAETKALKPWARAVVTAWVLVVVPLLAALLIVIVAVLPRILATAWDSLGLRWGSLALAWEQTDVAAAAVALLSMLLICLPVAGIAYILSRVVRRTSRRLWRATSGRAPLRAAAALATALAATGLVWAWWPDGQYQPIEVSERGTLTEVPTLAAEIEQAVQTAVHIPAPVLPSAEPAPPAPQSDTPGAGEVMLVLVPRPAEPVAGDVEVPAEAPAEVPVDEAPAPAEAAPAAPEPEEPAPAAPVSAAPAPAEESEWVFPFAPPREPREEDNQAVAVNTQDGSTKYEVALAFVWETEGDHVDQRNEAYALARCTNCRTVAVAFQVVLVVGYAQVVTPVNAAVAVNYACEACVTQALAMQLVATLTREPNEETRAELERIWTELEDSSEDFELRPLQETATQLVATRNRILELLAGDLAEPTEDEEAETEEAILVVDEDGDDPVPAASDDEAAPEDVEPDATETPAAEEPTNEPAPAPTDQEPEPESEGTEATREPEPAVETTEETAETPEPTTP